MRKNLGLALLQAGQVEGAIQEFRATMHLARADADEYCRNLELALRYKSHGPEVSGAQTPLEIPKAR